MNPQPVILVIDDVIENVAVLGAALSQVADVQFATSGQEGLELARRTAPDLILLDVMMPDMDGFEATSRLKRLFADAGRRAPPIIAITILDHRHPSSTRGQTAPKGRRARSPWRAARGA